VGIIIVILAILGSALTLALGGAVKHETVELVAGSQHVSSIYGELNSSEIFGYSDNFTAWSLRSSPSAEGKVYNNTNQLILSGSFGNASTPTATDILKKVNIDIASYPILEVHVNVTSGVAYGIRFFTTTPNGSRVNVWWEASPLDHRRGIGSETIRVNMQRQAFLATNENVSRLDTLELYVETPAYTPKSFQLVLSKFDFVNYTLSPVENGKDYRAVYLGLSGVAEDNVSWSLNRITLGVTITAELGSTYTIYLLDGSSIFTSSTAANLVYNQLVPSNVFTLYPQDNLLLFSELMPNTEVSIVIVVESGSFHSFQLNSVDFLYLPTEQVIPAPSLGTMGLYYTYFLFFLFLLPLGVAVIVFKEFFESVSIRKKHLMSVLAIGLLCRLALAATTAHVFDTSIFLASARTWFQYGTTSGSVGPTLPLTYFLYWTGYSPFALLQLMGFQDIAFLSHQAGVVESVFVKLFPMAMDILTFFTLSRFSNSGKALVWGSFYFLNPLAILVSSVWGQYESATVALIVLGIYWVTREKVFRAGLTFVIAAMIQFLGLIPLAILLIWTARLGRLKNLFVLGCIPSLVLLYPPQRELMYRIFLGLAGLSTGRFSGPSPYSLLGNLSQLAPVFTIHPLLIVGTIVLLPLSADVYRNRIDPQRILFYTAILSVAFLLLTAPLSGWLWILGIGLGYATVKNKDDLGAFMLVFGTAFAFLISSYHAPAGWAYYFFGENLALPTLPTFEAITNRLLFFSVLSTALGLLFLIYLRYGRGRAGGTLLNSTALVLSLYLLLFFWLGANPL